MKRTRSGHAAWIQPALFGRRFLPCCSCGWAGKERHGIPAAWGEAAAHAKRIRVRVQRASRAS